jgi:protein gp37
MTVYDHLEKWRDGSIRYVEKWAKGSKDTNGKSRGGQYKKYEDMENKKFKNRQNVGVWNKEPQQKIVPEINHENYVKGEFYRASISLNVPIHGTLNKPNYKNFTYVVVDKKDNIDMKDMYNKLIEEIEEKLHYKQVDFWFDSSFSDCDRQEPKAYSAKNSSSTFEGTDY